MINKNFLKIFLILSLSITFVFILSGNGICGDKVKNIDLSEYRSAGNVTFTAYKYAFGNQIIGTLQIVTTTTENVINQDWSEEYSDGTAQYSKYDYVVTAKGVYQTKSTSYVVLSGGGRGGIQTENNYNDPSGSPSPLLTLPFAVVDLGYMWGDAFIEQRVFGGSSFIPRVYQYAIVGLEDVSVPAGDFTDCVKIARFRGGQSDRIEWRAKGIGVVKMIYAEEPYPTSFAGSISTGYNRAYVLESWD